VAELGRRQRLDKPHRNLIGGNVIETTEPVERGLSKLADDRPATGAERPRRKHHMF